MATATIISRIVGLDEIIPKPTSIEDASREDKDMEDLVPWMFQQSDMPQGEQLFRSLFREFIPYRRDIAHWKDSHSGKMGETGIDVALKERAVITLPQKSWNVSDKQDYGDFIRQQGPILLSLLFDLSLSLDGIKFDSRVGLSVGGFKLKYVIGGTVYATRAPGALQFGPAKSRCAYFIIYRRQTWEQFVTETLCVMLGQLAANISHSRDKKLQDQEVFVTGFHGHHIHFARGFFTADSVSRVQSAGCSEVEQFELMFSRGYDLGLKTDWLEATRGLARLLRYLLSGNAKVAVLQTELEKKVQN
ncbi:hypothetical protein AJ79_09630 [Helicocarpus griseus UAMH5409]|uniref:Fungal-type protein kinase domain-containing protein n=1 Tax=Helicocarpus griseus UAMH5409 TaxID=1447875 RepID=A0A2B7WHU1_9EURO|nr:hypothetical protein AJ79_09630 [Helicocarpus griseus UAMH5409]